MYYLFFVIIPIFVIILLYKKNQNVKHLYIFSIIYSILEFLSIMGLYLIKPSTSSYNLTSYFITYKDGFVSRGLIGTLFEHIFKYDSYYIFKIIICYWIFVFIAFILELIIYRKVYHKYKNFIVQSVSSLFLLSFSSVVFFTLTYNNSLVQNFTFNELLRLDLFNFIIMQICLLLFLKDKMKSFDYIIVILLCCIGILIHQGIIFTFLLPIAFFFLYDAFYINNKQKNKAYFIVFAILILITFSCCQFIKNVSYEQIINQANSATQKINRTNITVDQIKMIEMEYKFSPLDFIKIDSKDHILKYWMGGVKYFAFYCIYNLIAFGILLKKMKIKIFKDFLFYLFMLGVLLLKLVLFILMIDWIRWIAFITMELFYVIVFLLLKDEKYIKSINGEKLNEEVF